MNAAKVFIHALRLGAAAAAIAAIVSCGGGVVGSGGTGRSPGVVSGTVNGFGSVIVDGVSYDDRDAPRVSETVPGQDSPVDVKLGQRVSVDYESAGVAALVHVEPTLVGVVSGPAAGAFTVYGQQVSINTSGASGPVTQLGGGYTQAADVTAGDAVEVHGVLVKQAGVYVVQATRVDKLAALPAYVRVTGVVTALNGASIALGTLGIDTAGAAVLPADRTLAVGRTVSVWAQAASVTMPTGTSWQMHAAQIRIRELASRDSELDDYLSGAISNLDTQAKTFTLGSQPVAYGSATIAAGVVLTDGQYVRVRGMVDAGGTLVANSVELRDAAAGNESELRGNISGFDALALRFTVRDVLVDASGATVEGCPASGLADGLYVEVEGRLSSNGVVANSVHCEDEPSGATIEREGIASAVDTGASTFTLTTEHGTVVSVQWSAATFFSGVTAQTLAGKKLEVEGTLSGSVLLAKKIQLDF